MYHLALETSVPFLLSALHAIPLVFCSTGLGEMLRQARLALKKSKRIDYYAILELDQGADEDQIKKAYRKAALKHHPDKVCVCICADWLMDVLLGGCVVVRCWCGVQQHGLC
jgi:hypothetical protein